MATVAIWKVESRLDIVVDYVANKEKTDLSKYKDLEQSLNYIKDGFKTEKKLYVDGINCNPDNAFKEMIYIKKKYGKTDGVLGWHAYHSYKEGEVTPELAHEIGLKVASEMWGDRFQVVVSTHLNSRCLHNHFVVNSVSFLDGKKFYANRTTYAELRRLSNVICSEYGLSTLKEKKTKSGINYLNYQNKYLTYSNYYKQAKEDLDMAIEQANTYSQFLNIMNNIGYEVINRSGKLSIRGKNYKRNIRIERYFGEDYSIENISKQILGTYIPTSKTHHKNKKVNKDIFNILLKPKYNNFYLMYVRYCSILNNYPKNFKTTYISSSIRKDVDELEELSNQAIFLVENKIETEMQFNEFHESKIRELIKLKNEKEDLWKHHKKVDDNEKKKLENKIDDLTINIKDIYEDVKMCEKIKLRKDSIKENLEEIENKEMIKNERIK